MNDKLNQTQRILRSPKFTTDERQQTVRVDTEETGRLELMSTQMLQQVMEKSDSGTTASLRKLASGEDGLIARDVDKDRFEIISDADLESILTGSDSESFSNSHVASLEERKVDTVGDDTQLELVSTQMLRIAMNLDDADEEEPAEESAFQSFDPYNKG